MKPRRGLPQEPQDTTEARTVTVTYAVRGGRVVPIVICVSDGSDTPHNARGSRIFRGPARKDYRDIQAANR